VRDNQPVLRYGRQYFRPLSGDSVTFGISQTAPGILAYSRLLSNIEVVIVANMTGQSGTFSIIVDDILNTPGDQYQVLYSNKPTFTGPGAVQESGPDTTVYNVDGSVTHGAVRYFTVTLQPMEAQILV
jgi:hypothetical protein